MTIKTQQRVGRRGDREALEEARGGEGGTDRWPGSSFDPNKGPRTDRDPRRCPGPQQDAPLPNVGGWEEVGCPHAATTLISLQHTVQQPRPRLHARIQARFSHLKETINTVSLPGLRHITKSLPLSSGVVPSRGRCSRSLSSLDLEKRVHPAPLSARDFHLLSAPSPPTHTIRLALVSRQGENHARAHAGLVNL